MLIDHAHCRHYSPSPRCLGNLPSLNQLLWVRQADINLILLFALEPNVRDRYLKSNTHLQHIDQPRNGLTRPTHALICSHQKNQIF